MNSKRPGVMIWHRIKSARYTFLFSSLIILLFATPMLEGSIIMPIFFLGAMVATLGTLEVPKVRFRILLGLALAAFAIQVFAALTDYRNWDADDARRLALVAMAIYIAFLAFSILALLRRVFNEKHVTMETIKGGISIYLLLGLLWAFAYDFLNKLSPGSLTSATDLSYSDIMYFSFVTLTTLGYGDIGPATWHTRNLAFMEAVVGQIYMTVLVARLVGLHLANRREE